MSSIEGHRAVLLHEVVENLCIQESDVVVDATLGGAGHARAIAKQLGNDGVFVGFDLDESAIERTGEVLQDLRKPTIHLINANFRDLSAELSKLGITRINKAVFDLGWSGYQLEAGRGFSFLKDEPLSMSYSTLSPSAALTAATIVNKWEEENIADVIFGWGEEHYSRRIAKKIVEQRAKSPIGTSLELAGIIRAAVPPAYRYGRIHPATRTFQALRIAVNDEIGALKEGLLAAWNQLVAGGRIAVISFHSIEDREVKTQFLLWEKAGEGKRITHKPICAGNEELGINPRARSAKLRVIEKIIH
ncbi:16S rRNA (cytosine(1402)-N(4))-methyltransferase [Candidatus Kaiserbacteria bacterium RIFCSPHIGHO2_02_FULL_49_16]|uniref:Ribosomal RNA small subunit methyltransferase H n=1 Tax=Candidatus Kaiserbacteria bacterium RIFCSPHIGHO2_02_FULL_49_16 TaxID=1798490 RepID=A0A1F6DD22_9BACT|nr:MAG: 16S rRNA (cytosine(1402)-N(4))-methyltransferase [Candidatus Kaiserbacteria bacterium RIFCSPHIGHO2_02_FULL_49_16]